MIGPDRWLLLLRASASIFSLASPSACLFAGASPKACGGPVRRFGGAVGAERAYFPSVLVWICEQQLSRYAGLANCSGGVECHCAL